MVRWGVGGTVGRTFAVRGLVRLGIGLSRGVLGRFSAVWHKRNAKRRSGIVKRE